MSAKEDSWSALLLLLLVVVPCPCRSNLSIACLLFRLMAANTSILQAALLGERFEVRDLTDVLAGNSSPSRQVRLIRPVMCALPKLRR